MSILSKILDYFYAPGFSEIVHGATIDAAPGVLRINGCSVGDRNARELVTFVRSPKSNRYASHFGPCGILVDRGFGFEWNRRPFMLSKMSRIADVIERGRRLAFVESV